eukprot:gene19982-4659_t
MEKQGEHHDEGKEKEGEGGLASGPPDDPLLSPGATASARQPQHRSHSAERSTAAPAAADVEQAFALTSSPVVRAKSGEALAAIQPAAAMGRQAMAKVVAVGRFDNCGGAASGGGEVMPVKTTVHLIPRKPHHIANPYCCTLWIAEACFDSAM